MSASQAYVDGRPADSAALIRFARSGYQHFTTMQVRAGAVRGLGLHLQRLADATGALFGVALDLTRLRTQMVLALGGRHDAGLRISIAARNHCARSMPAPAQLETLILVDPPAPARHEPVRLMSIRHQHPFPRLKHAGNFDLFHLRRQAIEQGYDDALLLDADGAIAEGPTFSIGFFAGGELFWPLADALPGTTRELLHTAWREAGGSSRFRPVATAELEGLDGAFCCNSGDIWPVSAIDDTQMPNAKADIERLRALWQAIPAEPIT